MDSDVDEFEDISIPIHEYYERALDENNCDLLFDDFEEYADIFDLESDLLNHMLFTKHDYYDTFLPHVAAQLGDIGFIEQVLESGYDVNTKDHHGDTMIYIAAVNGHIKLVKALARLPEIAIDSGPPIDLYVRGKNNMTLLHCPLIYDKKLSDVLKKMADNSELFAEMLNIISTCGTSGNKYTPLAYLIYCKELNGIKKLIELAARFNIDILNHPIMIEGNQTTPIEYGKQSNNNEITLLFQSI